jgi:hypothetical protein
MPHYTVAVFPGPSVKKNIILKAYARPTIPWSLKCEADGKSRSNLMSKIRFGPKASEPDKGNLMFWGIWTMIILLPNNASLIAVVILIFASMFIAACIVIKPFIHYIKYMKALDLDITYLEDPYLDWIAECSDPAYNPNTDDLLTKVAHNKKVATITTIFLGIWLCYSLV